MLQTTEGEDKLFNDFNDFLTLLTTQLQHQDPLSPLETSEFTNQLVGFANIEQQLAQTEQLKAMTASLESQNRVSALNHIGLTVEYEGDEFTLEGATVDIGYELPADTGRANITIYDEDDNAVASYGLEDITPGERDNFTWDGYRIASGLQPRAFQLLTPPGASSTQAMFEYSLPRNTDSAEITIRDGDGTVVATDSLNVADGRNGYVWDGVGTISGVAAPMPEGVYTYQISASPNPTGPALIGSTDVYEIMPVGNYRAEISVTPAAGVQEVNGDVRYFSKTRVTGVNGQGANILLELFTGGEIGIGDVLKAAS